MVLSHILMNAFFCRPNDYNNQKKNQDKSFTDYMSKTLRDKSKIQKINKQSKNTSINHKFSCVLCYTS